MVNLRLGEETRLFTFPKYMDSHTEFLFNFTDGEGGKWKKNEKEQLNKAFKFLNFLKKIKSLIDKVTRRTIPIS